MKVTFKFKDFVRREILVFWEGSISKIARPFLLRRLGNSDIGQSGVVKDSPADKAGIKEGDVILKINNDDLGQGNALVNVLSKYHPGDEVTLQVLRDGKKQDVKVKLGEMGS